MSTTQLLTELSQIKGEGFLADTIRWHPELAVEAIKGQLPDHRLTLVEIIGDKLVTVIEQL